MIERRLRVFLGPTVKAGKLDYEREKWKGEAARCRLLGMVVAGPRRIDLSAQSRQCITGDTCVIHRVQAQVASQRSALATDPYPTTMPSKLPAQTLLEKADKKANSSSGWFSSSNTKYEEAGDLYQQAANAFKIDKLFREAGDAHAREAECREKCSETNEAANAW